MYYKEVVYSPLRVRLLLSILIYVIFILGVPILIISFSLPKETLLINKVFFAYKFLFFEKIGLYLMIGGLFIATIVFFMFKISISIREGKLVLPKGSSPPLIIDINCIDSIEIINLDSKQLKIYMPNYLPGYKGKGIKITYHDPKQKDVIDVVNSILNISFKDLLSWFKNKKRWDDKNELKVLIFPSNYPEKIKTIITTSRKISNTK